MSEAGVPETTTASPPAGTRSFVERVTGALRLDSDVYDEVAGDPSAFAQAASVAVLAAAARAFAAGVAGTTSEAVIGALAVFAFWPLIAVLVWGLGGWFGEPAALPRCLRAVGFAMAPLLLVVLAAVPNQWVQSVASLVSVALLFAALVIATRQALRCDTGRAAFVCLIAGLVLVFLYFLAAYLTYRPGGGT